jgi:hypothetical protein
VFNWENWLLFKANPFIYIRSELIKKTDVFIILGYRSNKNLIVLQLDLAAIQNKLTFFDHFYILNTGEFGISGSFSVFTLYDKI